MTTNTKNILWITERFSSLSGGMAVSAERQVFGLRKKGFRVDVLFFSRQEGPVSLKRIIRDNGVDICLNHFDEPGNAAQRAWREIRTANVSKKYDLVVGFGAGFPGYVAVTFAAWMNLPSMVSVRGNDFDRDWFEMRRAPYVQESLSRADVVAVVALEKKEKIEALFPGKRVFWAPNGVDAQRYNDLLPAERSESQLIHAELAQSGRRVFGIFGELKYKKRIPVWLSAIRLAGLMDKLSLLVVGKMDAETHAVISDPVLSPLSKHFSFRDPDKLPEVYAACDFILIPSLFEGFPNVLLEAMASGCVPMVSDAGAMADILSHGENGFLFEAENRQEIVQATSEALLLSDNDLAFMKKKVAKDVRDRFSLDHEIEVLVGEIVRLMGDSVSKG